MPKPERIKPEIRKRVEPHLREHILPEDMEFVEKEGIIDKMFENVVYTYPEGVPLVTLDPIYENPAMQFHTITGDFVGLTEWDYIQEVDVDRQLEEAQK